MSDKIVESLIDRVPAVPLGGGPCGRVTG